MPEDAEKSIPWQLREHIVAGDTPEQAARAVLSPYGSPDGPDADRLCAHVWPMILKEARAAERALERATRHQAFRPDPGRFVTETSPFKTAVDARTVLRGMRVGGISSPVQGHRVKWDEMTIEMLDAKIAMTRAQVGGLIDFLNVLTAMRSVLAAQGARQLGDIENWGTLVADKMNTTTASVNDLLGIADQTS